MYFHAKAATLKMGSWDSLHQKEIMYNSMFFLLDFFQITMVSTVNCVQVNSTVTKQIVLKSLQIFLAKDKQLQSKT